MVITIDVFPCCCFLFHLWYWMELGTLITLSVTVKGNYFGV